MNISKNVERVYRGLTVIGTSYLVTFGQSYSPQVANFMLKQLMLSDAAIIAAFYCLECALYTFYHPALYNYESSYTERRWLGMLHRMERNTLQAGADLVVLRMFQAAVMSQSLPAQIALSVGLVLAKGIVEHLYEGMRSSYEYDDAIKQEMRKYEHNFEKITGYTVV